MSHPDRETVPAGLPGREELRRIFESPNSTADRINAILALFSTRRTDALRGYGESTFASLILGLHKWRDRNRDDQCLLSRHEIITILEGVAALGQSPSNNKEK